MADIPPSIEAIQALQRPGRDRPLQYAPVSGGGLRFQGWRELDAAKLTEVADEHDLYYELSYEGSDVLHVTFTPMR